MPPITLHMVLARQVALDLAHDDLPGEPGAFLLGATSPDIRVLTRQDRFSTHFFDLNETGHQDSVANFLAEHGRYVRPEALNTATRAWVSGYLSHLSMDELYITGIYRRFFAAHDELGGRIRANVMDRLLQFELDREYGNDAELKRSLSEALACTVEGIDVAGFVDQETLERWRQVTLDVANRGMDWERMRSMVSNHLRFSGLEEGETLGTFLDSLPELLDETIAHVSSAEIDGFVATRDRFRAVGDREVPGMRIIRNAEEGRRTLLARRPLDTEELPMDLRETTFRAFGAELDPDEVVRRIIRDVREDGDNAIRYYNQRIDNAATPEIRVTPEEIRAAYDELPSELVEALRFAADRIRQYPNCRCARPVSTSTTAGSVRLTVSIQRVGIYVPGTAAPLPSTVLMCVDPRAGRRRATRCTSRARCCATVPSRP